jgi:biotin carboxyl carrier protein
MEFKIEELNLNVNADINDTSKDSISATINGKECRIKILNIANGMVEFLLNGKYHNVRYTDSNSKMLKMLIDGKEATVNLMPNVTTARGDSITDKSRYLTSSIPGKVISVLVKRDDHVKKGDPVIVVESMKMQVRIKAHKDGVIKDIKVKEGTTIARNDTIAIIE